MVLQFKTTSKGRITKKTPPKRSASSPSSPHQRTKRDPGARYSKRIDGGGIDSGNDSDEYFSAKLDDLGLVQALSTDHSLRDVAQYLQYIHDRKFDAMPERTGMSSTRIAEVLNFRKNLPPIVSVAHVHALTNTPTTTEREIAELVHAGTIRRISIPGYGLGSKSIGDHLVLTKSWVQIVRESSALQPEVKEKYISVLKSSPTLLNIPASHFAAAEASDLVRAGFLTSAHQFNAVAMLRPDSATTGTLTSLATVGARAAAGSAAATGGENAFLDAGGGGGGKGGISSAAAARGELNFSLPSIGPHLRLLNAARTHMTRLLSRSRYSEAPADLLAERWNGGVASADKPKRSVAGLEGPVLPGKTKKWKQFYGLRFRWVLEECLGTGLVEVFDTGSVGLGVRLTS